jgi:hypothetical protein
MALTNSTKYPPQDLVQIAKSSKRRFSSARFRDFAPCPNPELNLWSGSAQPPNLELWSSSQKFRFELWFRTKLQHP